MSRERVRIIKRISAPRTRRIFLSNGVMGVNLPETKGRDSHLGCDQVSHHFRRNGVSAKRPNRCLVSSRDCQSEPEFLAQ